MRNYIVRGIDRGKNFRFFVAKATDLVNEAVQIHHCMPTAAAALGRTLIATAIIGYMGKNKEDKISVQIKGDGDIKNIICVADNSINVKGYISNPLSNPPLKENGKLDVGSAIGRGKMIVIKDLGLKDSYVGQSELLNGEIAEDFANYFARSEQQPSAVSLGVTVDRDYTIKSAGGFIIQVLPDANEEAIDLLEKIIREIKPISTLISEGYTPEKIIEEVFKELEIDIIDKKEMKLECDCSKEKIEGILLSLGEEEIQSMIDRDKSAEVICHFCNTKYLFEEKELKDLILEI
ncbi:MAG: Hsp33 family molecular chaperone HslO [Andreesenia angusta]|nr:Hsp33 family molecular chaperone HslO [Andreesenia angusta]